MHLSISARIFGGLLAVTIVFSGVMGYSLLRMHRVRQDLHLVSQSYLKLTSILDECHVLQNNLLTTVDESARGGAISPFLRTQVRLARNLRTKYLRGALAALRDLEGGGRDREFSAHLEEQLRRLERAFRGHEPLFEALFDPSQDRSRARAVGHSLLRQERRLASQIRQLRKNARVQVRNVGLKVEVEENNVTWAILALVAAATLITVAATFGFTLRPLKTLLAGTQRIGSGEYAHRVSVDSHDELGVLAHEFNRMAAAIEEREQRLIRSERMAAIGQIASHITHEIRNPLSSVSLNTELLDEELESSLEGERLTEPRNLCRAIRREVDRLTEITEEYLRFARLPKPRLEPESVNEILQDLLSFMSGELRDRRVAVSCQLQEDLPPIEADENQLRQAFLNLLRNAGEAMAPDGGSLTLSTRARDGLVELVIADTGSGIAREDLPKVFDPFFSTKETGTGLGLALTQQIIQEHGGTIAVESVPREGTVFTVRLPAPVRGGRLEGPPDGV